MLREPDPVSDCLDAWSAFFDTLKESAARMLDEATAAGAKLAEGGAAPAPAWANRAR